jgi:glyceraldehyde 3-phosphate dehydrogenase
MNIGINGLGRIGKSILIQSLKRNDMKIKAINIPDFNLETLPVYLTNDSCHKTDLKPHEIHILNNEEILVRGERIKILNKRNIDNDGEMMWIENDVKYLIDTTGGFLTSEKAKKHNSPYFIMCAPAKDDTPQYLYNGNHELYSGEKIISNSSCTTNSLVPLLKLLNEMFDVISANFITVHAATASQNVIDGVHLKSRVHRSIINNIIPHTTGASKSAEKILPDLKNKIFGTSVRVPTNNVSMIDLNVRLACYAEFHELMRVLRSCKEVVVSDEPYMVSSDFMTTTCPTIIDSHASMAMGDNEFKFTIWYDNEWSYSTQALKLISHMEKVNLNI